MKNKFLIVAMCVGLIGLFTNPLLIFAGAIIALTGIFLNEK